MEPILKMYKDSFPLRIASSVHGFSTECFRGCRVAILERSSRSQLVIERIIFPPGTELPAHRHPNVSVLDFGISGNGSFSVRGHKFANDESNRAKLPLYVPRNIPHGGIVGDKGATIVSFQYWYEWPPKESIFLDWEAA